MLLFNRTIVLYKRSQFLLLPSCCLISLGVQSDLYMFLI